MTANDFFLLFVAFGGFLIAPALLLWGFMRITRGKPDARPGSRPDRGSPDVSRDPRSVERRDETPDYSRRVAPPRVCFDIA